MIDIVAVVGGVGETLVWGEPHKYRSSKYTAAPQLKFLVGLPFPRAAQGIRRKTCDSVDIIQILLLEELALFGASLNPA